MEVTGEGNREVKGRSFYKGEDITGFTVRELDAGTDKGYEKINIITKKEKKKLSASMLCVLLF